MSRGSADIASAARTSMTSGQPGVPTRRESLSVEMDANEAMMRPLLLSGRDTWAVASWGDRIPHARDHMVGQREVNAGYCETCNSVTEDSSASGSSGRPTQ